METVGDEEARVAAFVARYGHDWTDPDRVREYVDRVDGQAAERAEAFGFMAALLPFERTGAIRILDIGTGHGAVAAALLDVFPSAVAVGLDISEPMMAVALERMAGYGERFRYHLGDFADGQLPSDLPSTFEVAVSSRAIHHLPTAQKRLLYGNVLQSLATGGCFFNLDTVAPSDEALRAVYRKAAAFMRGRPVDPSAPWEGRTPLPGHYFDSVDTHLRLIREAGFAPVDCFWKRMNNALIGGYKPGG